MRTSTLCKTILGTVFAFTALAVPGLASAVDEQAAKALWRRNDCNKCHAKSRDKKGPSLKKIAKELNAKSDAEQKVLDNMTNAPKVKLLDSGKEEEHKVIDTKDEAEKKNLAAWILSH